MTNLALRLTALGLIALPLSACVETEMADAPLRSGSAAAESACIQAVNTNFGRPVARVTSSDFSQAATEVMLTAEGETWRCLASQDGRVDDLSVVG